MSKYTTEVRYICETLAGYDESQGYSKVNEIVGIAAGKIFENFPIYDEAYRLTLETKILRHFYTREIGFETVGLWMLHLNNRMNEIMPKYNLMYRVSQMNFDPFTDVDVTRTRRGNAHSGTNEGENLVGSTSASGTSNSSATNDSTGSSTGSNTRNSTNEGVNKFSDTPQGGLADLREDRYMSSAQMDQTVAQDTTRTENQTAGRQTTEQSGSNSTTGNTNSERNLDRQVDSTEEYVERITGKQGGTSYAKMVTEYVKAIVNVDMLIIGELEDLFMGVW